MELKRVIREWKLWLALALLLLGNIFCFYQEQKTTYGSVAAYADGSTEELLESAKLYGKSPYGSHLKAVAEGKVRG